MATKLTIQQAIDLARKDPNSEFASMLRSQIESGGLDQAAQKQNFDLTPFGRQKPEPDTTDFTREKPTSFIGKTRDFAASVIGGGKLAEGIGQSIAAPGIQKDFEEIQQRNFDQQTDILKRIKTKKEAGEDTSALERALEFNTANIEQMSAEQSKFGEDLVSNKEVIGSAARLASTIAAPSIVGGVAKGGIGLQKGAELSGGIAARLGGAGTGIIQGAKQGAKIGAAGGAIEGTLQGGALALENEGDIDDVLKGSVGGAVFGTLLGGAGGAVIGGVTGKLEANRLAKKALQDNFDNLPDSQFARYVRDGQGKITNDKVAQETIKQGADEGTVAMIKGSSSADKQKMAKALDILEEAKNNKRFSLTNRPSDVIGDSLAQRIKVIATANKKAGQNLDSVAKGLRGQLADPSPAVSSFMDDLADLGVGFKSGKPVFSGSQIDDLAEPQKIINSIVKRMENVSDDAFEIHNLKRFIDEQVTFGKTSGGLTGRTEGILKGLRTNLDSILDNSFPEYNKVNTLFSTTRGALDDFSGIAGKKVDLTGKGIEKRLGTLARRITSNAQSRVDVLNQSETIDTLAKQLGGQFDDDLLTQVGFIDEIERLFGTSAPTSLQGQEQRALQQATGLAGKLKKAQGATDFVLDVAGEGLDKVFGKNEQKLLESLRSLIK